MSKCHIVGNIMHWLNFLYQIPFKVISFFVPLVKLCDIFIRDLNDFIVDKIGFSLKINYMPIFFAVYVLIY